MIEWLNPGLIACAVFILVGAIGIRYYNKKASDAKFANPPLDLHVAQRKYESTEMSFALYGDSIARGCYSSDPTVQPTALLQNYLPGTTWEDHTMPGRRLLDLIPLISPVEFFKTRFTVIEHGVIDAWQGYDIVQNYRNLIARIIAEGSTPIVTGFSHQVVGPVLSAEMLYFRAQQHAKLRMLCAELGVLFCDLDTVEFDGEGDLIDKVHPARAYSDRLVIRIAETLKENGIVK